MSDRVSRRVFIGGAAAVGLGGMAAAPGQAGEVANAIAASGTARRKGRLPRRGEFTIRNAYVLTMDPSAGDIVGGDVHVRNGRIVAVGKDLKGGGRNIDGRKRIVLPGLIDTHWHLWTTLFRSMSGSGSKPANGYFPTNVRLGSVAEPGDLYNGARLSLADAINSGITTVHDWAHNLRGPEYADANLRAHADSGVRGRFSYGTAQGHPADKPIDFADIERVQREWFASGRVGGLVHLGLAGRPPGFSPPSVYRTEYAKAREMGLPVSYHANSNRAQGRAAMIQKLGDEGMLGPHVQIIHALYTTASERKLLADTATPVSVSPWSELLVGYGVTPIHGLWKAGVLLNLSVDTTPLTGTAEMFSVMRLTAGLVRGQGEAELEISARQVLEMATTHAAKGMGIDDVVGSLTPGKRADLIMVRSDDLNMAPFFDAPNMIALAAGPQNVDTVVIDGRILKRDGRLTHIDTEDVTDAAQTSLRGILARAAAAKPARAASSRMTEGTCC